MTTSSTPTIPGRCGIHLFTDPERARTRACDVCQEALAFALETSKVQKVDRSWSPEHREKMKLVMGAQKRQMQGIVAAHRAERSQKATADAHAAESTSKMRNAISGRFERVELDATG